MRVIKISDTTYLVLNEKSSAGYPRIHIVRYDEEHGFTCSCEHYKYNKDRQPNMACKHIIAVFKAYGREVKVESNSTLKLTPTQKRRAPKGELPSLDYEIDF